jgi:hypothetical protein
MQYSLDTKVNAFVFNKLPVTVTVMLPSAPCLISSSFMRQMGSLGIALEILKFFMRQMGSLGIALEILKFFMRQMGSLGIALEILNFFFALFSICCSSSENK